MARWLRCSSWWWDKDHPTLSTKYLAIRGELRICIAPRCSQIWNGPVVFLSWYIIHDLILYYNLRYQYLERCSYEQANEKAGSNGRAQRVPGRYLNSISRWRATECHCRMPENGQQGIHRRIRSINSHSSGSNHDAWCMTSPSRRKVWGKNGAGRRRWLRTFIEHDNLSDLMKTGLESDSLP